MCGLYNDSRRREHCARVCFNCDASSPHVRYVRVIIAADICAGPPPRPGQPVTPTCCSIGSSMECLEDNLLKATKQSMKDPGPRS